MIASLDDCVVASLSLLTEEVRVRFATDPLGMLRSDLGLVVEPAEHLSESRSEGGACDGLSFLSDGVILFAPSPGSRRRNFTLAHELGHYLVDRSEGIYDWLAQGDDPARLLETVCDRVAQELLLPDDIIESSVPSPPLRAQHVLRVFEASHASRQVCAIGLAKRIPCLGAIALLDSAELEVVCATVRPDSLLGWPTVIPWRGQKVPAGNPLAGLQSGQTLTQRVHWKTAWGAGADFYVDAYRYGAGIVAVFAETDLWGCEEFHGEAETREFDTRPVLSGFCCGRAFERRGYPCSKCRKPYCPQCGSCECERLSKREIACRSCYMKYLPHLVVDGLCIECRQ